MQSECLVILKHQASDRERIQKELYRIVEKNDKNIVAGKDPVELDVVIDIAYRERSPEANRLMWSLYNVLAEIMNRENKTRMSPYTAQELHDEDMVNFAPKHVVFCKVEAKEFFIEILNAERGDVKRVQTKGERCAIEVWQTTRFWNTFQISEHIQRLLNTLEDMHVTKNNNGDIDAVFKDFEKWRAKNASKNRNQE
jgi:hypothetical protein